MLIIRMSKKKLREKTKKEMSPSSYVTILHDFSHRTKGILHVRKLLGNKRIGNTLIYTQLGNFDSDEYVQGCKI